jgi:polyhydroxyalkanoate synthesis regulator protein
MSLRKFVRYANRKMHEIGCASETEHVSMVDLADIVVNGEKLEVIDDVTGEDLTVAVLARILYNRCLKDSKTVTADVLHGLIVKASKRAA